MMSKAKQSGYGLRDAKNGEARSVPVDGELAELIERRREARQVRKGNAPLLLSGWIFHRDGEPVGDFRKAWATACIMAGLGRLVCPQCEGSVDSENKCSTCAEELDPRGTQVQEGQNLS